MFGPVCFIGSHRVLLAIIACQHDRPVNQVEEQVAVLETAIDDDAFVRAAPVDEPRDMKTGENMSMTLKPSLYYLIKTRTQWCDPIDVNFSCFGLAHTTSSDRCVYTHTSNDTIVIISPLVDGFRSEEATAEQSRG